jgi:signal transduction histidine kinase
MAGWQARRNPFFRRLGCFFFGFFFLSLIGFLTILGLAADALGIIHTPFPEIRLFFPFGIVVFLLMMLAMVWGARSLHRMSMPLDDLLEASNRIAEGDYSVRVQERGPKEARSLGQAFNSMVTRLQTNDRQRRSMLADLSHELRTPLTVMRGNLEGMLDGLYPVQAERLKSLLDETQLLSRLVDDLRTLSLAESGALELKREPTDLAQLAREVVAAFETQAGAQDVRIETHLDAEPLAQVDALRVYEILTNLVSNALHYSPRAGVVKIHITESESGEARGVRLSVEDNGPGIPSSDLAHIFERFYKSGDSGGMGLGLAIAKYLVEAHGGRITAESVTGAGTRISFTLPRYPSQQ